MNIIVPSMIVLYFHTKINRNRTFVRFVAREVPFYAHIHMYVRIWVCVHVCMSIFELAYLTNYDYWSNIVRSLSVVKYRFFSRDLLCTSHGLFHYTIYNIFLFYYLYFFSFFYSLGTPRAKRYNRLYLSRAHYVILTPSI